MEYFKKVYDNGITLIVDKSDNTSFANYSIAFLAGSQFQDDPDSGIAHVLEHVLAETPTKSMTYDQIHNFNRLHASWTNASTNPINMNFYGKCFSDDLLDVLNIRFEQIFNPDIKNEDFLRERAIVYEEMYGKKYLLSGKYKQMTALQHILFPDIIDNCNGGLCEKVEQMKFENILEFYHKYITPNRIVIALNGNVDIERLNNYITQKFAKYPVATPEKMQSCTDKLKYNRDVYIIDDETNEIEIEINLPYTEIHSRNTVLNFSFGAIVCNDDEKSEIQKKMRLQEQLTYWTKTLFFSSRTTNHMAFSFKTSKLKEAFESLLECLYQITKNGVDEESLLAYQAKSKKFHLIDMENQFRGDCMNMAEDAYYDVYRSHENKNLIYQYKMNITNDDIKEVAKSLFRNNKIMVVAKSKTITRKQLEEFFPIYDKYCKMVAKDEKQKISK